MRKPTLEKPHPTGMGGWQKIYRFKNGYGASVVFFPGSYGYENGLYELAVVKFCGDGDADYNLTYETPITDDVIGSLSEAEVDNTLLQIEALTKDGEIA